MASPDYGDALAHSLIAVVGSTLLFPYYLIITSIYWGMYGRTNVALYIQLWLLAAIILALFSKSQTFENLLESFGGQIFYGSLSGLLCLVMTSGILPSNYPDTHPAIGIGGVVGIIIGIFIFKNYNHLLPSIG